jgi:hypothetical protein
MLACLHYKKKMMDYTVIAFVAVDGYLSSTPAMLPYENDDDDDDGKAMKSFCRHPTSLVLSKNEGCNDVSHGGN